MKTSLFPRGHRFVLAAIAASAPLLAMLSAGCSKPAPTAPAGKTTVKPATGTAPARGVMQAGSRNRKH